MKFFIDTANVDEIKKANDMGIICGVTTNPSLIAKEGRDFKEVITELAEQFGIELPKTYNHNPEAKTLKDEMKLIGDRYYLESTATLIAICLG